MKVIVDNKVYPSKNRALEEFKEAMICCDGSEAERMTFAYLSLLEGCTIINTYKEIAQ